jgi:hypothetical protein
MEPPLTGEKYIPPSPQQAAGYLAACRFPLIEASFGEYDPVRFKDMAARTLLLKLERAGLIQLPKRRGPSSNGSRNRNPPLVAHATESIRCALRDLRPLTVSIVEPGSADLRLFNCLLSRYHYLGHRNTR